MATAAAIAALATGAAACGGDDDDLSANDQRYCELTAHIEAQAEQAFSSLGDDSSDEDAARVQRALLADVDDELDELTRVAPEEISDDVAAFVASFRAQMRGEADEPADDSAIVAWEEDNCPS